MAVRITRAGVGLTVGIIVVTALIIGGLFWIRERGEQARREEAIQIAEQNLNDQSNEETALNEGESSTEESTNESTTEENSSSSESATSEESEASNSQSTNEMAQTGTNNSAGSSAAELPQTGPAESFFAVIALAALGFAAASYVLSLRQLKQL